jgi:hypothetical protein
MAGKEDDSLLDRDQTSMTSWDHDEWQW